MALNLLHPHCGPFNAVSAVPPNDPIDRICWKHDKHYDLLQKRYGYWWPYLHYNWADAEFIREISKYSSNPAAAAYLSYFLGKKATGVLTRTEFEEMNMRSAYGPETSGYAYGDNMDIDDIENTGNLPVSLAGNKRVRVPASHTAPPSVKKSKAQKWTRVRFGRNSNYTPPAPGQSRIWAQSMFPGMTSRGKRVRYRSLSKNATKRSHRSRSRR